MKSLVSAFAAVTAIGLQAATTYTATEQYVQNVVKAESNRTDIAIGELRQDVLDANYLTPSAIKAGANVSVTTNESGEVTIAADGGVEVDFTTNNTVLVTTIETVAPATNIAKSAIAQDVQASLDKADTALQMAPVTSVNSKTGAVALTASDVDAIPIAGGTVSGNLRFSNGSYFIALMPNDVFGLSGPTIMLSDSPGSSMFIVPTGIRRGNDVFIKFPSAAGTFALLSDTMRFSTEVSYAVGDVVFYNGAFYRCTTAHTADAWNASHFSEVIGGLSTGTPTAPTPTADDDSTKIATTAFVQTALSSISVNPLSGNTYNFSNNADVQKAVKDIVESLGGSVTNFPAVP